MEFERRLLRLERQNFLLKLIACPLALAAFLTVVMGAASVNQDAGELLKVKKLQLVDAQGEEVAVIDANGIRYSNKGSQVMADAIVGRSSVSAVRDPKNKERFIQMSVEEDKRTCSFLIGNRRAVKHWILLDSGNLTSGID